MLSWRAYSSIKAKYQSLLAAEELNFDPHQMAIVDQLQHLQEKLRDYEPSTGLNENAGFLGRVRMVGLQ